MVFIVGSPQKGHVRKENLETIQEKRYRDLIYEFWIEGADIDFLEALTLECEISSNAKEGYNGR